MRYPEAFEEFVRAQMQKYTDDLEQMCERSLTDPLGRGVLVIRNGTGWTMSLDPEVPWATIHEYPNGRDV